MTEADLGSRLLETSKERESTECRIAIMQDSWQMVIV